MGVPGFFSWILRHYKNNDIIMQVNKLNQRVDVLYLDANCLFHPQCFKILDNYQTHLQVNEKLIPKIHYEKKNTKKLENMMMIRIINYIDFLLNKVKPKKQLYIAVDGVAPMAKMNQQRQRRYRSVDDKIIKNNIKKKYNIPFNDYWNNTVITPGTHFMEKLHGRLIKYIEKIKKKSKISIIYSSYHTPGEGEHKILQNIKGRNDSNDDIYVIYGLDADLIFLSLASKKSNIYLLREITHFRGKKNEIENRNGKDLLNDVKEDLNYVSIDNFRKYLNIKFNEMILKRNQTYVKESDQLESKMHCGNIDFTDDFIFICYFLGNDFIPHLPSIDIKTGGIDFIIGCYLEIYLTLNSHIISTENGVTINNIFLEMFLKDISKSEDYYFRKILPRYKEKIYNYKCNSSNPYRRELWNLEYMRCFKIYDPIQLGKDKADLWKWRYYEHYCGMTECQQEFINEMCNNYLKGILWTTQYYFNKCPSWRWQYYHFHAPFISDITAYYVNTKIDINLIKFQKSKPLQPCEQLLAVLPPPCAYMLPKEYKKLILSADSPIIDMYPEKIKLDMINKSLYWKCIPYIPRIDIKRIENATKNIKLSKFEKSRNSTKEVYIFE